MAVGAVPDGTARARHDAAAHHRHRHREQRHPGGVPVRRGAPGRRQAGEQRPHTFHGKTPGEPFTVDLELFSTAYDVPAGHRLALVVDTADPLYIEHNPAGARLTFSSPPSDPSYLSVPLRVE
ncbi:CocE/NonD family hydrolase C-terminal non-catalytic domain-containing protein [Streptomyces somaliensis]|uniref:CocE/NonD family hydrolase C-terminal non-catalytic domain-containing protein n=1 Tax=Streptomyces somaliensis TaxID=78355 RepID=UPI003558F958